jgi:V/A-type H+-transporting ATPase subunit I
MRYINIIGYTRELERVIDEYIAGYEIHLEDAVKALPNEKGLSAVSVANPYARVLKKAAKLISPRNPGPCQRAIPSDKAVELVEYAADYLNDVSGELDALRGEREAYAGILASYLPYQDLDFEFRQLHDFRFITWQFGKMPLASFQQFEAFLYHDPEILFVEAKRDQEYLWGIYFTADFLREKVDSVFSSLHFSKMTLPPAYGEEVFSGTAGQICAGINERLARLDGEIAELQTTLTQKALARKAQEDGQPPWSPEDLYHAREEIRRASFYYDARKYAARTENDFFIFVGWMTDREAARLEKRISGDDAVVFIQENEYETLRVKPPTKLNNPPFFRAFEFFVRMYGLPAYGEMDPTIFVALTYTLLFGFMFGDIGQGAALFGLGLFLRYKKNLRLGPIMSVIGLSSMFFGLMFGSVFGFEFEGLWLRPQTNVPTILTVSIITGIALISFSMLLNMINAFKRKDLARAVLSHNGLVGFVFYISLLAVAYLSIVKNTAVSLGIVVFLIVLPLLLVALKEPLVNALGNKKRWIQEKPGLFVFETIVNLFEVLLGFFTNTISYVRVGAFVLSHACMMSVVMLLSEKIAGGAFLVVVLGNLFVLALEGLIVGIQVLRLEFYEMFSRFYDGSGREFAPYKYNPLEIN